MIRQAISCDICGTEKKQTNNWFVVHEQAGEIRIAGWNSRNRLRAGSKHLCGQTCLHKLVDEFMARTIAGRSAAPAVESGEGAIPTTAAATDTSLTSGIVCDEFESSARLITPASPATVRPMPSVTAAIVPMQPAAVLSAKPFPPRTIDSESTCSARQLRAEAWERERERELHGAEHRVEGGRRRRIL